MSDHFIRVHPVSSQGREDGLTTILIRADTIYRLAPYEYAVESDNPYAGPALGTALTYGALGHVIYVTESEDVVLMLLKENMAVAEWEEK